ncbi:b-cell lymphoma 6 protein homolog [Trichonephila clavipes]|nr:b-cell lymphoma 6 protein homolog [Trichonephila clavipes]
MSIKSLEGSRSDNDSQNCGDSDGVITLDLPVSFQSDDRSNMNYQCDVCSYSSKFYGNLKRHYLIHTGQKPYVCNFCGKSFNQKVTLTTHIRLHTGERPYSCEKCPLRFYNRASLVRHVYKHAK